MMKLSKRKLTIFLVLLCFVLPVAYVYASTASYVSQYPEEVDMMKVTQQSVPAVVGVYISLQPSPSSINDRKLLYGGAGFILSSNGYILTSDHLVNFSGVDRTVQLNDGKLFDATLVSQDFQHDLALLKISADHLPFLPLGSSAELAPGQTVITIGNPMPPNFPNSMITGVVSGLNRELKAPGAKIENGTVVEDSQNIEDLTDLVQIDATVYGGNSGGPLLDLNGNVVGILEMDLPQAPGIGFAMPIEKAFHIVDTLKNQGTQVYTHVQQSI